MQTQWLRDGWSIALVVPVTEPYTAGIVYPQDHPECDNPQGCPLVLRPGEYVVDIQSDDGRRSRVFTTGVPGTDPIVTIVDFEGHLAPPFDRVPSGVATVKRVAREDIPVPPPIVVVPDPTRRRSLASLLWSVPLGILGLWLYRKFYEPRT